MARRSYYATDRLVGYPWLRLEARGSRWYSLVRVLSVLDRAGGAGGRRREKYTGDEAG